VEEIHCTAFKITRTPPWSSDGVEEEMSKTRERRSEVEET
jgi:hypothetical protein